MEENRTEKKNVIPDSSRTKLASQRSRTLKMAIQQLKPFQVRELPPTSSLLLSLTKKTIKIQIWDWLFRSCEINGRLLLGEGLISGADIEECFIKGKCKKLSIKLPAWCILQCLLRSAKSDSHGLLICMFLCHIKYSLVHFNKLF